MGRDYPAIRAGEPGVDTKTAAPVMPRAKYADPKAFRLDLMSLATVPIILRADAAKQLLPYMHARMGETGKKETAKEKARAIARGGRSKFEAPPKLTVVRND